MAFRKLDTTTVQQAVTCLLSIGFSVSVWAVDAPNAAQGLESLPPAAQPMRGDIEPLVLPAEASAPTERAKAGPAVQVKGFAFTGNTVIASDELAKWLVGYQGKTLTLDELLNATDLIQSNYRDKGYFLAQALLPSQDVADGIVQIRIVEGQVGQASATIQPGAPISQAQADGYMGLLPPGALITESSIERPLLLLSDLPGVAVTSVLKPGAEPGTADLVVDVANKGKPIGGSVFLENHSSKYTGQYRLGFNAETRGVLGFGEVISLTAMQSFGGTNPDGETKVTRLGLTIPVGYLGTKVAFGYTDFDYEVGGIFASTKPTGTARVASVLLQHPYVRSRNATHFFHAGFDHKLADDRLSGGATILARRELRDYHVGLNGDFRDNMGGGALNSYLLRATVGDNDIKNANARAVDASPVVGLGTQGGFMKVRADYYRLQKLANSNAHALMVSARTQWAMSNLDSAEKMSLGGPTGVRAYSVGAASADNVVLATVEYRYTVPSYTMFGGAFTLSSFYDYGSAKINHKPVAGSTALNIFSIGAIGVGVNWFKRDDFQMRFDVASRTGSSRFKGDDIDGDTRAWLSLQKWF